MTEQWDGVEERRAFCAMHCRVVEEQESQKKDSTPWRVFIFTAALFLSTMGGLIVFHQSGMETMRQDQEAFKLAVNAKLVEMESHLHDKVETIENNSNNHFERLFQKIDDLTRQLAAVSTKTDVIRSRQELVLKKIRITE